MGLKKKRHEKKIIDSLKVNSNANSSSQHLWETFKQYLGENKYEGNTVGNERR